MSTICDRLHVCRFEVFAKNYEDGVFLANQIVAMEVVKLVYKIVVDCMLFNVVSF